MALKKIQGWFCPCRKSHSTERDVSCPTPTISVENVNNKDSTLPRQAYKVVVNFEHREWFVFRRFAEFQVLFEIINKEVPDHTLILPDKNIFNDIATSERGRGALDSFIQKLMTDQRLVKLTEVREFLQLDRWSKESSDSNNSNSSSNLNSNSNSHLGSLLTVNLGPSENKHVKPSDFEFLKVIGKGSFGKVLLARHRIEMKYYAVKVLSKKQVLKRDEAKHIMSERSVLLKNLDCPFLVDLHYSYQTPDKLYFVLDYVNGGELFFHLQKDRYFTEPRARFYAAEICAALGYLHGQGIIYRDLKPENLLLDSRGHIVLTDFGLSKEGLLFDDQTHTFCGTPEYLAPEVLKKEGYDSTVDWWCLGAVMYEMMYGLPPFYTRNTAEMYDRILNKPVKLKPSISEEARDILAKLLHKDRQKRLGAGFSGFEDIKRHAFFKPINWPDLLAKRIEPPFNPNVAGEMDLHNIDPEFTKETVSPSLGKDAQSQMLTASVLQADNAFAGFSYAPPMFDMD